MDTSAHTVPPYQRTVLSGGTGNQRGGGVGVRSVTKIDDYYTYGPEIDFQRVRILLVLKPFFPRLCPAFFGDLLFSMGCVLAIQSGSANLDGPKQVCNEHLFPRGVLLV